MSIAKDFLSWEMSAPILAALSTIIAAIASALTGMKKKASVSDKGSVKESLFKQRLGEIRTLLSQEDMAITLNRWSSSLLVFGQYVIGGVLASSFIQEKLSSNTIGVLGVLVLLSSLVYQRYRPDIKVQASLERSVMLKALLRNSEDDLEELKLKDAPLGEIVRLSRRISEGLSKIECCQLSGIERMNSNERLNGYVEAD